MEWGGKGGFITRAFTLKKKCLNAKPEVNVNILTNILLNFKAIMNGACFVFTINQEVLQKDCIWECKWQISKRWK